MTNPLLDKDFLLELDQERNKEQYVKIISLSYDEEPQQEITGLATQGTINIDGSSSVRRTCSLTLIAQDLATENFWIEKTKFKVEVGIKNNINSTYPDIIWFPMGTYVISSFTQSVNSSSNTISITGKDKMSLLNGELGGTNTALSWDFGTLDTVDENGTITTTDIPIKQIIRDLVHQFTHDDYKNIIINDLDENAVELLEYKGAKPLYAIIDYDANEVVQMVLDGTAKLGDIQLDSLSDEEYDPRFELDLTTQTTPKIIEVDNIKYSIAKIESGMTVGYRATDLTYSGDLIASLGESATSILDKIVTMLGNYEYYYDLDGRFIFQRKKSYISTSFNNLVTNEGETTYAVNNTDVNELQYSFKGNQSLLSIQNTPNISDLKNDYSIWGSRSTSSDSDISIHLRYAIDEKPEQYKALYNSITYIASSEYNYDENSKICYCDWRELIYQMAVDYYRYANASGEYYDEDFLAKVQDANGRKSNGEWRYPNGVTGYERYYIDINGFWRDLYCPLYSYYPVVISNSDYNAELIKEEGPLKLYGKGYYYVKNSDGTTYSLSLEDYDATKIYYYRSYIYTEIALTKETWKQNTYYTKTNDVYILDGATTFNENTTYYERTVDYEQAIFDGVWESNTYYILNNGTYILDTATSVSYQDYYKLQNEKYYLQSKEDLSFYNANMPYNAGSNYYCFANDGTYNDNGWKKTIYTEPEKLNFWFDFLDTLADAKMGRYSIVKIGDRAKTSNEDTIKAIYFRETPNVVFYDPKQELIEKQSGYTYIQYQDYMSSLFVMSAQGKSAKDELDEELYNYGYCADTIQATAIPIYYLEPNRRVAFEDNVSGTNGEYIITKMTLPLAYSGTMSITASRVPDKLY